MKKIILMLIIVSASNFCYSQKTYPLNVFIDDLIQCIPDNTGTYAAGMIKQPILYQDDMVLTGMDNRLQIELPIPIYYSPYTFLKNIDDIIYVNNITILENWQFSEDKNVYFITVLINSQRFDIWYVKSTRHFPYYHFVLIIEK